MATSILIVKLSSLGDVIHTLPAAQAIRAAWPEAKLGWAVERQYASLLLGQPWLDEVIEWERKDGRSFVDFVARLRRVRWDVAIDFQGLFRSGLVSRSSGARRRIGYAPVKEWAHWFYNDRVHLDTMDRHAVERYLDLAARLGAKADWLPIQLFPLHPTDEDRAAVAAWCLEHAFDPRRQHLVILNPHCRKDANRWPAGKYTHLARELSTLPGVRVALSGGAAARALCDEIAGPLAGAIWRADGRFSVLGSAVLFRQARALVTGDSGPMHIAVAMGTPVVALFGAANPLRTGPYAADAIVLDKRLPCSPCFARHCPLRIDPPPCMDEIGVDQVLTVVKGRLAQGEAAIAIRKTA